MQGLQITGGIRRRNRVGDKLSKKKKTVKKKKFNINIYRLRNLGITVVTLAVMLGIPYFGFNHFTVKTVIVDGNVHYSDEEITEMVLGGRLGKNSLYLTMKYRNKQIEDVPFIETMDVTIVSADTVKITVYEKTMAGYVEYMDRYFYFDKDGTVVESSDIRTLGIPQIKGLDFDHIVLLEKLPVEDDTIFNHILDISQLMDKYGIVAEQIYFDKDYKITLYFGDAKIKLGNTEYIDEKIMKLKMILPSIEGKRGTLRMENYTPDSTNVTFELEE